MAIQTNQSQFVFNEKQVATSKKETTEAKWKLDSLFKILSYVLYGFFFGLLPSTFKFSPDSTKYSVEISSVVAMLGVAIMSIAIIYWTFKGDIRRYSPLSYYITHSLNAVLLTIGLLWISFMPISNINDLETIKQRQFIMAITSIIWAVGLSLIIFVQMFRIRTLFPLSWSRIGFSWATLIINGFIHLFIFLAATSDYNGKTDNKTILLILSMILFVIGFILFIFALSYIKVYRDVLLGERTSFEIQAINDWESAKVLAIVSSIVASITFIVSLLLGREVQINAIIYLEAAINALFVLFYFIVLLNVRLQSKKLDKKQSKFVKMFKSIDHILLLETIIWIIVIKTTLIQGFYAGKVEDNPSFLYIGLAISFASIALIYVLTVLFSVNIPNLRNTIISISSICGTIILGLFTLVFTTNFRLVELPLTSWLPLFMSLSLLIGISISLIVRVLTISKIFKSKYTSLDLEKIDFDEMDKDVNDFSLEDIKREKQENEIAN